MPTIREAFVTAVHHHEAGQLPEAEQLYRLILQQQADYAPAVHGLGLIAYQAGHIDAAIAHYRQAIALKPNFPEVYNNLGLALVAQGEFASAIAAYRQAIQLNFNYVEAHTNLGHALRQQGCLPEALAAYDQAIAVNPNFVSAHWNRALGLLLAGDLRQGFREYEWRWRREGKQPRPFAQPCWDGSDLQGRKILLYAEQGCGDTIQFVRYATWVAQAKGGQVIVECQAPLVKLIATMPGVQQAIAQDTPLPDFDVQMPLMSLPTCHGTTLETVPAIVPYLRFPANTTVTLPTTAETQLKVGIVWSGNPENRNNLNRSCQPQDFRALLQVPGVTLYSLQKEATAEELAQLNEPGRVYDLSNQLDDFASTAAAIAQLDLVITVDTAVAHLAGALGKPVWVLLCFAPDWRWMLERDDTPWYPTMRLFRQPKFADWASVFEQVVTALQAENAIELPNISLEQGLHYQQMGQLATAEKLYRQILQQEPDRAEVWQLLGAVVNSLGRPTEAIAAYEQAIALKPDFVEAHANLGVILNEQGQSEAAIAHYQQALAVRPNAGELHHNLAVALAAQDRLTEAVIHCQQAIALRPNFATTYNNLGTVWEHLGEHEKSLACYQQAIAIQPEHVDARFSRAVAWLRAGNLRQGFIEYEWRWRRPDMRPQAFRQPIWDGSDLQGQPILLHAEQGFGDTIQFARYAELVAQRGGQVIVACQRQLARLLRSLPAIHQIAVDGETLPQFAVHAPLLSLPRILGTTLETIPAAVPYLQAPPAAIALTVPPNTRAKVGIVWTGSPTHPYNYKRTCPLPEWEPLLRTPGVAFYSLQKGPQVEDLAQLPDTVQVQDLSEQLPDFAETAAAIAQLDLVITIDTSVAHLAGALGKPVWLLLDTCPDWRWLLNRDDSPWYPTMRLFRQTTTGDWVEVIERVQAALQTWLDELPKTLITDVGAAIATAIQHHQADRWSDAEQIYRQVLQQNPQQLDALHLLGVMAHQKKNFADARAYLTRVLALEPNFAEAHTNLASTLREQGDFTNAIAHTQKAIALNPSFANNYVTLGFIYRQQGNLAQAIAAYNQALAINPDDIETHWNRALVWLLAGDFRQGFAEYEWRWQRPHRRPRPFTQPLWDGSDLRGQRILLHAEQGFGDTIQFIRYASLVADRGGKVIVECQEPLLRLLQTVAGIDQLVAKDTALPEFDVHTPLLSLPRLMETTLATIPAAVPYLTPPRSELRLTAPIGNLKVGLVWSGSRTNQNNHHRACPPHELQPLLTIPGISYYCLQKEKSVAEWAELTEGGAEVQDLSPLLSDFAETAAAIAQLDLVITVDTAVAHLAGALGKPVWLLLTFAPDWRWMLHRPDSPWYPTMRLFRQSTPDDWAGVIKRVTAALEQFANRGSSSPQNWGARGAEIPATERPSPPFQAPATASATPQPIGIGWQVGLMTGWGVYGLNLTLQLLRSPSHSPMLLVPASMGSGMMNPLHQVLLQPAIAQQQNLQGILASYPDKQIVLDKPILHALGKDFASKLLPKVSGQRNIGVVFFEDTHLEPEAIARAKSFEAIVAGSQWNADVLRSYGCQQVHAVPQGVDPTIFHPAPRSNLFGDRFVIFSGGKLEHRKGQDIIVAAFKRFHARHPDALLVTAWHNFWPQFMVGLDQAGHVQGLPKVSPDGRLEIIDWLTANGISADACVDVGPIPNHLAGQIVREADVAVFTNRAEGGTNLVAMECLACGVPTILSANTGHLDLIGEARCYPLQSQGSVKPTPFFRGTDGWGESDVEEVVEALEQVYRDRTQARQRGWAAVTFMQDWTWEKQVKRLLDALSL